MFRLGGLLCPSLPQITRKCLLSAPTVTSLVDRWTGWLETRDVPEARQSAQLIIAHVVGKKMIHEVPKDHVFHPSQISKICELCEQRHSRMPVQYILQEWDFHDLTLMMRPPVFIPRPETEELAHLAYKDMKSKGEHSGEIRILELGSGSGALSVFLLSKLPKAEVTAVDQSEEACSLTRENARRNGVHRRLTSIQMDYTRPESCQRLRENGLYDLIIANPPYLTTAEVAVMEPELTKFEDPQAFHGGADGLHYVRIILKMAGGLLTPDRNALWMEVGLGHCEVIRLEVTQNTSLGLHFDSAIQDFTNRDRFCVLRK